MKEKYQELWVELRRKEREADDNHELSETQKEKFIKWTDVLYLCRHLSFIVKRKKLLEMKKEIFNWNDFRRLQQSIALHLYSKMEPLRLDYAEMRLVSEESFKNNFS